MSLTNPTVFEPRWNDDTGALEDTRRFLPNSAIADIQLWRDDTGAHASIPQRFVVHSPTGFEWGYGGSGPADLALNVLALFLPAPEAWRLHQHFKGERIAALARSGPHTIEAADVRSWIQQRWNQEDSRPKGATS